jgi:hypothetical protein
MVSVYGWPALMFLGYGEVEHHDRRVWYSKITQFMAARKQTGVMGRG